MININLLEIRKEQEDTRRKADSKHKRRKIIPVVECLRQRRYVTLDECHKCIYLEYFTTYINELVAICNYKEQD